MKRLTILLALAGALTTVTRAQAQTPQGQDVQQELRTMLTGRDASADRAVISDFLNREDVQRAAALNGIDVNGLQEGVQSMSDEQAARVADRVVNLQAQLAGGDTFVISATTIIIILLLLILITN